MLPECFQSKIIRYKYEVRKKRTKWKHVAILVHKAMEFHTQIFYNFKCLNEIGKMGFKYWMLGSGRASKCQNFVICNDMDLILDFMSPVSFLYQVWEEERRRWWPDLSVRVRLRVFSFLFQISKGWAFYLMSFWMADSI